MGQRIKDIQKGGTRLVGFADHGDRAPDDLDAVLEGWSPGRNVLEDRLRVAAARAALQWLRDRGSATASDFKRELYQDFQVSGQDQQTWWENTIKAGLEHAIDAGLVECDIANYEYRWISED